MFSKSLLTFGLFSSLAAVVAANPPSGFSGGPGGFGGFGNSSGWGFGGDWGSGNGNWGFGGGGVCSQLSGNQDARSSAWSCVSSAVSSLMATKTGDSVWSSCDNMMMVTPTATNDNDYNSCQCSWLLGPQANCIATICTDGGQFSSYQSSISSKWGCSGSPTDAPTISNGIVYAAAANTGKPSGSPGLAKETSVPMAMVAGVAGVVAMLV